MKYLENKFSFSINHMELVRFRRKRSGPRVEEGVRRVPI